MKSDLRINFGVLEDITAEARTYKNALETMAEVLESVNNKLQEENEW